MNFVKKWLKVFIGIAALIMVIIVAFFAMRSNDLEGGTLKNWRAASVDRRAAAARILTASDDNTELIVACVDKIATLPDSGEMAVRDAVSLCHTGVQLKQNM